MSEEFSDITRQGCPQVMMGRMSRLEGELRRQGLYNHVPEFICREFLEVAWSSDHVALIGNTLSASVMQSEPKLVFEGVAEVTRPFTAIGFTVIEDAPPPAPLDGNAGDACVEVDATGAPLRPAPDDHVTQEEAAAFPATVGPKKGVAFLNWIRVNVKPRANPVESSVGRAAVSYLGPTFAPPSILAERAAAAAAAGGRPPSVAFIVVLCEQKAPFTAGDAAVLPAAQRLGFNLAQFLAAKPLEGIVAANFVRVRWDRSCLEAANVIASLKHPIPLSDKEQSATGQVSLSISQRAAKASEKSKGGAGEDNETKSKGLSVVGVKAGVMEGRREGAGGASASAPSSASTKPPGTQSDAAAAAAAVTSSAVSPSSSAAPPPRGPPQPLSPDEVARSVAAAAANERNASYFSWRETDVTLPASLAIRARFARLPLVRRTPLGEDDLSDPRPTEWDQLPDKDSVHVVVTKILRVSGSFVLRRRRGRSRVIVNVEGDPAEVVVAWKGCVGGVDVSGEALIRMIDSLSYEADDGVVMAAVGAAGGGAAAGDAAHAEAPRGTLDLTAAGERFERVVRLEEIEDPVLDIVAGVDEEQMNALKSTIVGGTASADEVDDARVTVQLLSVMLARLHASGVRAAEAALRTAFRDVLVAKLRQEG